MIKTIAQLMPVEVPNAIERLSVAGHVLWLGAVARTLQSQASIGMPDRIGLFDGSAVVDEMKGQKMRIVNGRDGLRAGTRLSALLAVGLTAGAARPAVVTNLVTESFDDGVLEAGLTSQGSPVIAGGTATLAGASDAIAFDASSLVSPFGGNWAVSSSIIVEAVVDLNLTGATFENAIDLLGQAFVRESNGAAELGVWDGSDETVLSIGELPTTKAHLALVFDSATGVLSYYADGAQVATVDRTPGDGSVIFTFGNINHPSVSGGRVAAGEYDAIAVSSFTGDFDAATDFVLPVPEPGSFCFAGLCGALCLQRRR